MADDLDSTLPRSRIEFVTKHFAARSAALALAGIAGATVLIHAYLSVFDWELIWVVEYSDLFKAGLLAVGLVSVGVFVLGLPLSVFLLFLARRRENTLRIIQSGFGLLVFAFIMSFFYFKMPVEIYFAGFATLLITYLCITILTRDYHTARGVFYNFFIALCFLITTGQGLGSFVKSRGNSYTVRLEKAEISDLRLVMLTSRNAVFPAQEGTIVLPLDQIVHIRGPHVPTPTSLATAD